jgi:hypothetical protein
MQTVWLGTDGQRDERIQVSEADSVLKIHIELADIINVVIKADDVGAV